MVSPTEHRLESMCRTAYAGILKMINLFNLARYLAVDQHPSRVGFALAERSPGTTIRVAIAAFLVDWKALQKVVR